MSKKRHKRDKHALDDPFRDERAMELFGKPESLLQIREREILNDYIQDWLHPVWKITESRLGDQIEVNNVGQIRDIKTKSLYKIYSSENTYPFIYVTSKKNNCRYVQSIHPAVARAFCDNDDPEHKTQVDHINANKQCNWYRNLEWVTPKENMQRAERKNLMRHPKGEDCPWSKYTAEQIEHACQLLQDSPNLTFGQIAEAAGITEAMVGVIYRKDAWVDISKNYSFPPNKEYMMIHRGEDNGNSVYTVDQVIRVCNLLQDHHEMNFTDIAKSTGASTTLVKRIYYRNAWSHISKDYTFLPRDTKSVGEKHGRAKFTTKQAIDVCRMLDDVYLGKSSKTHKEIADILGVSKSMVDRISAGDNWTTISSKYKFLSDIKK